jgi:hypothetical protein
VVVFAVMSDVEFKHFSWAFWLTVAGSALFLVSGITAAVAACRVNKISSFGRLIHQQPTSVHTVPYYIYALL